MAKTTVDTDVAVLQSDVKDLKSSLETSDMKHEQYRKDVHIRMDNIHDMYNRLKEDVIKADSSLERRTDSVEHSINTIDKIVVRIVDELKVFGKDVTDAINEIKTAISTKEASGSGVRVFLYDIAKLAAFVVSMLAIMKYGG